MPGTAQLMQFAGSSSDDDTSLAFAAVQDVHFGYTGEREVVGGVSLSVEPGQSIALVGPSGSGKSTILKLLMRLYDVNSGSILLDGIDTRDLQQASLYPSIVSSVDACLPGGLQIEQLVFMMLSMLDTGAQHLKIRPLCCIAPTATIHAFGM